MKKSNFPLGFVIAGVAAALFGFVCFLSLNFFWPGEFQKALFAAIGISIALWLLVWLLHTIKTARRNFQRNAFLEILMLLVFFTVAAACTIVPYAHYFTVYNRKQAIKDKVSQGIDNTIQMFDAYEKHVESRTQRYEFQLTTAINGRNYNMAEFLAAGFKNNGEDITDQKKRLMRIFNDDIRPLQFDSTKKYAIKWLEEARKTATNWVLPVSFMKVVDEIQVQQQKWLAEIKTYDGRTPKARGTPFDYPVSFASTGKELTDRANPSAIALASAAVLVFLILVPYLFAQRNPKNGGLAAELFGGAKKYDGIGRTL